MAKASAIKELLTKHFPSQHDFGSDIIPGAKDLGFHVQALIKPYLPNPHCIVFTCRPVIMKMVRTRPALNP